jgi:OOP family OmpA-OmpF porin
MFKKIAIAATLALLASTSFAAETPSIYAGVDVGSTKIDDISDRKTSFGGFVGYKFTENLAVEGGYRRLADFDEIGGDLTLDQAAVSVIGILPLSSGFNVFGRLGYNRIEAKASAGNFSATESTSGGLYGVGVGYTFTPTISVRLEVQKPSSDSTNVSAGISYKF